MLNMMNFDWHLRLSFNLVFIVSIGSKVSRILSFSKLVLSREVR